MADTAIAITAGTGTNVDTRTEATNGNHRQVIVVGDPATNAGVAPVSATQGLGVNVISGGIASGAVASGAIASGAVASGAFASGSIADGADVNAGSTSDAASATTTMSGKLRGIATALGVTALDRGTGAGGAATLRVTIDSGQLGALGQTTASASTPVVIASDQAWPVSTIGFMKKEDVASADGDAGIPAMVVRKATPANTSGTDGDYEFLQSSAGALWVGSAPQAFTASVTFTPAAASHVANDCNGAAGQFSFSPTPVSASNVMITDVEMEIDGASVEATAWRLYLYNITPPSATADDGAWDLVSGDRASFLGYVDIGTAVDLGSTQWVEAHSINKVVKLAGTTVFGYLVNLTTLTPANVAHIVKLYGVPL